MKKVLIVGAFDFKTLDTGGQPVKTRELFYGLSERYGENQVDYLETIGWKKHPLNLLLGFKRKAKEVENIIMLPAHNGLFVFSKLLLNSKKKNKNKIFYDVVGGWLSEKTKNNPKLLKRLKEFDGIWAETSLMKKQLNEQGLNNVNIVRNFKNLKSADKKEEKKENSKQLKLCTFSRVMQEKGIEDAVEIVKKINEENDNIITLDIYGFIADQYKERFEQLKNDFTPEINYKGVVASTDSVETLSKYDALLFPTKFKTEGLPGTIIDAYAAGIPVISARWNSFEDIVEEGKTGIGYKFGDNEELKNAIMWAIENKNKLFEMKDNCRLKAKEFSPEVVIDKIVRLIEE